ncbi:DUF4097 family beta strand repeat protein [Lactobacillus sp. S2-2]|uniref:DUF4097 family beta strand repeat-containing protein n=1 Tax=Lactobacillus sp. S2-2 TaxID=2692917 RepID=UPI001F16DA87|nr:DUF4097 family beta strand repeat-containing protein [Lactobacillus sp. S2-2]MCF6515217.1 DUF4097 family beta strand repeat protein [Lactobacillus sp. S2-2]
MKKSTKWIIGLICLFIILLLGAITFYQLTSGPQKLVKRTQTIDNNEIENLKINAEIPVKVTIGDRFKISSKSNQKIKVKQGNQTLKIKQEEKSILFNHHQEDRGYLNVTIPKSVNLSKVVLKSEINSTEISGLAIDYLDVDNEDGEIMIHNVKNHRAQISSEDGDVSVHDFKTNRIDLENEDGDFGLKNIKANYLKLDNEDGDIHFKNSKVEKYHTLDVSNEDGDISLKNMKVKHYLEKNDTGSIDKHNVIK